jgi:hypothetical protein
VNLAPFPPANTGEAKMNHEVLRLLIQRKVRDGRLPHHSISRVWSSASDKETCVACDTILAKEQLVMEGTTVRSGRRALQFHVRCFQVWDSERRSA